MPKPDIFIIVTDSARAFFSNSGDDREKPEFYNQLDNFVECKRAYCSAPSSVMSGASIISSVDAYMISRNYDNFRFNNTFKINNIENIKSLGYDCKGFFVARELREKLGKIVGIDYVNLPSNLKFSKRMWKNEDLNIYFDNYLESKSKINKPLFNIIWNNIRFDYNISKNLDDLKNILIKHGKWDNSIIFYLSDHGYPTKDKGITPEGLKRDNKTHDLWLTEDNIRIPFYFKTPYDNSYKINENVAATDIFPTIYDVLGLNFENKYSSSVSLTSKNKNRSLQLSNRSIRVDSRFIGQTQRKTAIINGYHKLVFDHDKSNYNFYELSDDYNFEQEISTKKNIQQSLLESYSKKEIKALDFQYDCQFAKTILKDKNVFYGDYDKYLLKYLSNNGVKNIEKANGFIKPLLILKSNSIFINLSFKKNFFSKIISIFLGKNLHINLVSNQEVLKWNLKRFYLAFKTSIPFLISEPSYLLVRIKEIIKIIKKR